MFPEVLQDGANQLQGLVAVLPNEIPEQALILLVEFGSEPGVHHLIEGHVRLVAVHDGGARVYVRRHRIGLDEMLAEAVNRRAGDLIERLARELEVIPLRA